MIVLFLFCFDEITLLLLTGQLLTTPYAACQACMGSCLEAAEHGKGRILSYPPLFHEADRVCLVTPPGLLPGRKPGTSIFIDLTDSLRRQILSELVIESITTDSLVYLSSLLSLLLLVVLSKLLRHG